MIVACVAVKNEPRLPELLAELRPYIDSVVVADETEHPRWGGIGPSLVWAWREALHLGARRVIQIDAGGSHHAEDIPLLLASDADVVIGSRFLHESFYEGRAWRAGCSRGYGRLQAHRARTPIKDWTSGFRAFTPVAAKYLASRHYTAKMHGWQAEVLHRALDGGLSVAEVPIRYTAGESSLRLAHVREAMAVR